jgi:hypothetical protein
MPDLLNIVTTKEIEDHKAGLALFAQQQKLSIDLAIVVIRSMILVIGGAIIAILAFVGNLWTKNEDAARHVAAAMQGAIECFGAALFLILVAGFFTYLSVTAATHVVAHSLLGRRQTGWWERSHNWIRLTTLVLGILSFAAFGFGVLRAITGYQ